MIVFIDALADDSAARGPRALPPASAPRDAPRVDVDAGPTLPLRRGRRRDPDGLDQRPRSRALPHGVEPLWTLRSRDPRPTRLRPPAPLRVLGTRRVPRADVDPGVVAPRDARLPGAPYRLVRLAAAERQGAGPGEGGCRRQRADEQRGLRGPSAGGRRRMVELEARPARPALPVDDGRAHHPIAASLPQALRLARARDAGRRRRRAGLARGVRAMAPGALAARDGRGDRGRPPELPHVPAVCAGHAADRAARDARGGRGDGHRGGRFADALARAHPRRARARPRRAGAGAVMRNDPRVPVRLAALVSGPERAPLR